jgi:hypothetical protein
MSKTYIVTIPIAGHISFEIEAETEEAAIQSAWDADPDNGDVTWEMLESFGQGNVCHCPSPWEVEVEEC